MWRSTVTSACEMFFLDVVDLSGGRIGGGSGRFAGGSD